MSRVTGPMAVLAGLVLMIPGIFGMLHGASTGTEAMPTWLIRDLIVSTLSGVALTYWGTTLIRQRELELNELQPARIRRR